MGDLLTLAHDLADRLILAFDQSSSGIPHPRVHLIDGIPTNGRLDTCLAGAGSLLLELGAMSRLLGKSLEDCATFAPRDISPEPLVRFQNFWV